MSLQLSMQMPEPATVTNPYANSAAADRGAVFTRESVVEFILDLTDYVDTRPLASYRLLEPSFGEGDFLLVAATRLLKSITKKTDGFDLREIIDSIRAVEVHEESVRITRKKLKELFLSYGHSGRVVDDILSAWLITGDFLLVDFPHQFTHVVGNPPYLRQEAIPMELLHQYKTRYRTIYDRADLYVPFIERGLHELRPEGKLAYICSDRWMKNRYGQALRRMVSANYHLQYYIDMVGTDAFDREVSAYPAITVIERQKSNGVTRIAHRPDTSQISLTKLRYELQGTIADRKSRVFSVDSIVRGSQPWILNAKDQRDIVLELEKKFPALEEAGCRVGIGVATGADRIYIVRKDDVDIESDRLVPLVRTRDIASGSIHWQGDYVINPFQEDGRLVDLNDYPKLNEYLEYHKTVLSTRNCAKRHPNRWYRTIDRIHPLLQQKQKLLIPDIKGSAHIVFDNGAYYPHHNLYFVLSSAWDLRALQTVLKSGISTLFIAAYSTRMRGGYYRFQAQYLRRIRIPLWRDISEQDRASLIEAGKSGSDEDVDRLVLSLYELTDEQIAYLMSASNGEPL